MGKATIADALRIMMGISGIASLAFGFPVKSSASLFSVGMGAVLLTLWAELQRETFVYELLAERSGRDLADESLNSSAAPLVGKG